MATARSPRYTLRRRLALRIFRKLPPGRLVEFGCGSGDLLPALSDLGYSGVAVEPSEAAASAARGLVESTRANFTIVSSVGSLGEESFDYGCAFEVLEHIEDDEGTLKGWREHLVPGGMFVASVPAHMKFWTESDAAVGHRRRYERPNLGRLFRNAGFAPVTIMSYGFPLTALSRRLRNLHARTLDIPPSLDARTEKSAAVSTVKTSLAMVALGELLGAAGHAAQLPFLGSDRGDGYFMIARNPE